MRHHLRSALLATAATLLPWALPAQQPLPIEQRVPALLLGAAWYPEQWPEQKWEADLALMEAAHIHLVRVGEFAWSTMEPSEGNYQLDWLERAIRAAEKHHIAVVLGTPGAAPPAWLTQNIRRRCEPKKTAARISTATGNSSTGPIRNTANSSLA